MSERHEPRRVRRPSADLSGRERGRAGDDADLSLVLDVPVDLVVEIGRTRMTIRETLGICRARSSRSTGWPASPSTCSSTAVSSPAARSSRSTRSSACA